MHVVLLLLILSLGNNRGQRLALTKWRLRVAWLLKIVKDLKFTYTRGGVGKRSKSASVLSIPAKLAKSLAASLASSHRQSCSILVTGQAWSLVHVLVLGILFKLLVILDHVLLLGSLLVVGSLLDSICIIADLRLSARSISIVISAAATFSR